MIESITPNSLLLLFWLKIIGWCPSREVIVMNNKIYVEIAEEGQCQDCKDRILKTERSLNESKTDFERAYFGNRHPENGPTVWFGVKIPDQMTNVPDIAKYIAKVFDLEISQTEDITLKNE